MAQPIQISNASVLLVWLNENVPNFYQGNLKGMPFTEY